MVLAFLTAIVCATCRCFRSALIALCLSAGAFVWRAAIGYFFGAEFQDYEGDQLRPYEVYNDGAGIVPGVWGVLLISLSVLLCLSYLARALMIRQRRNVILRNPLTGET